MRILIADRFGAVRDEIIADVDSVTWTLNAVGTAQFAIATTDPKATDDNLRPGNRIYVQFSNGLPPWAGVIDLPRTWRDGKIICNAYTIEYVLQYRLCDRSTTFNAAPVGAILGRVLREVQAVAHEGIELGQVWFGGQGHYPRYHYKSVWQIIESIRRMEMCDVVFQPMLTGGRVKFIVHLLERWGTDKRASCALVEGANISTLTYEEQGPLVNAIVVAGAGTTWTNERAVVRGEVAESVNRYGLREKLEVRADVTQQPTLEMHARVQLTRAYPLQRFGLTVVDALPSPFAAYDVGDIIMLHAYSVGWGCSGPVRVIGREFKPGNGTCALAVDRWSDEQQILLRDEREEE